MRGSLVWIFRLLPLTVCFAPALFSQSYDGATLRSNTRLVQLDVIAEDKKGRPVNDLTRQNFEIYDQGKLQQIRIFTRNSIRSDSLPVTQPGPSIAGRVRLFTNMAETRSGPGTVTVLLIDSLNTKWVNQAYARQQVIKFLLQIRPQDRIAIYSMGWSGFHVLYDFTQDAAALVAKLSRWTGDFRGQGLSEESSAPVDLGQQLGAWLAGEGPDFVQSQYMGSADDFRPQQSLQILTAIANQLASIPGRKNVIWVSEGFPIVDWSSLLDVAYNLSDGHTQTSRSTSSTGQQDAVERAEPRSYQSEMATAMRAISDDNVAIYPVDAVCLFNPFVTAAAQDTTAVGFKALSGIHAREQVMDDIAKRTGGKAFYETNDLKNAIRLAMEDAKTSYTLGFYPESVQLNGKFRVLKVKVVGRHDVRLRYRQGYIDSPEAAKSEGARRARLQDAIWSPLDANSIALSAKIEPVPGKAGGAEHLQLKINTADLNLSERGGVRGATADIVVVQKDERGKVIDMIQQTAYVEANATSYPSLIKSGIIYSGDFTLHEQTSVVRIVVADVYSDRLGSISISRAQLGQ